jgi:hypothetical protein
MAALLVVVILSERLVVILRTLSEAKATKDLL